MQAAADDRLAFAPPQQPGLLRALVLAVVAHLLLVAALTTGLQWKRDSTELSAEAELWSAVPQQAATKEVVAPPPPTPVVKAPPVPEPPVVKAPPPAPEPPARRDAEIALEREKDRIEKEKLAQARREEAERRKAQLERERERKAEAERKLAAERKREEEQERKEQQAKVAAEKKRKEEELKKKKAQEDETRVAKLREENLKRIQGMAGGTGSPSSSGSASVSSGPSASWAGRVRGKVRPNIVFSDEIAGNPTAEVEVRMAPDGTIVGKRLVKASGNRAWDDAVLRALDKTEILPRDTDGRVHSPVVITFRPKD